jgi:hypothetical protein
LLDEVLDAHGGRERWRATPRISAHVRSGGLLPRTRMPGNRLADYRVTVDVAEPRTRLDPFPGPGRVGVFDRGAARVETAEGEVLASRAEPRAAFSGLGGVRRNLRWDALDSVYFAGYAMWNYLTTPYLLAAEGVEAREGERWVEPNSERGEPWRRLEVTFPEGIPTHSRRQTFYFCPLLLLRRHDYVAEVVGRWAKAAHYCGDHLDVGGLVFPTRRWVVPRRRNSTSTGTPNGSCAAPTALRAWRPASPQSSSTRSVNPLTTAGGRSKPFAQRTRPSAFTQPVTRSRSPSSRRRPASIERHVARAASYPCSSVSSAPTRPV